LLLQRVTAGAELDYVPFASGVPRRGPRAPGVAAKRPPRRRRAAGRADRLDPRPVDGDDLDPLAELWHEGWRDAHEAIVPAALAELRTVESLRARLEAAWADIRVVGPVGRPLGFTMLKDDELYQFYVGRAARGTGLAAVLMADAERQLAARGVATAWLACAIGNDRAARFYEKQGWRRIGVVVNVAETERGPFPLEVWRYEKPLPGVATTPAAACGCR
jgi:GNAT superfamily N-acetyltransferase